MAHADSPAAPATPAAPSADAASLLARENFATRFARGDLRHRRVMRLHALLEALRPDMPPGAFAEWLEDLTHWLQSRGRLPEQRDNEDAPTARLRTLLEALDFLPAQRDALRAGMARLFARSRAVTLFTDVGVPSRQGFFSESLDRLSRALLPDAPVEDDLGNLLPRLFRTERAAAWFEALPPELGARLFAVLALPAGEDLEPLVRDMRDAVLILATRIGHHGLANDVRARSPAAPLQESPFFRLPEVVRALLDDEEVTNPGAGGSRADLCRQVMGECRRAVKEVRASLEHTGVSVDLVYRLDLIRRQLDRLYTLLGLLAPQGGAPVAGAGMRLVLTLIRGGLRDRSLVELFRSSTRLLSRRVVDSAAHGGEKYVTRTRAEWHQMISSAGGGGALVPFGATAKFFITWAALPLFFEGFFAGLNYVAIFVGMQLLHFTLATKQPAMTAATLASAIKETGAGGATELSGLAEQVARTVRSQLAAFLGNLGVLVPVALLLDLTNGLLFDRHLLDEEAATRVLAAHHPLGSGTLVFAAATGAMLWLSSIIAGGVENWAVYRQLGPSLAGSRVLRAVAGRERAERASSWLMRNLSGLAGNVALGLLLGLVPSFARFVGLPLEVRHVTFVTAQIVFAGVERGPYGVLQPDFLWAAASIFLVLLVNFGVSFALALWVAMRARDVGRAGLLDVGRAVWTHFRARPADFVRPPKEA